MFKLFKAFNYLGRCAQLVSVAAGTSKNDSMDYVDDFVKFFAGCMHNKVEPEDAILLCSNGILSFFLDGSLDSKRSSNKSGNAPAIAYMVCRKYCDTVAQEDAASVDEEMLGRLKQFEELAAFTLRGLADHISSRKP
jgi:hypothetical protein